MPLAAVFSISSSQICFLIGEKQPLSLLENRKLLPLLPEVQEQFPWQPLDKESSC